MKTAIWNVNAGGGGVCFKHGELLLVFLQDSLGDAFVVDGMVFLSMFPGTSAVSRFMILGFSDSPLKPVKLKSCPLQTPCSKGIAVFSDSAYKHPFMIGSQEIADTQARWTQEWHSRDEDPVVFEGFWTFVLGNHRCNFNLWHEEDCARREDMGFEYVYRAKRAIDGYNQRRNDFIERIDEQLFESLKPAVDTAPIHSETPGMIIDRLSIMALKHYHMVEQTQRTEVGEDHRKNCRDKATVILRQREDLTRILGELLEEIRTGQRAYRVYFQFKMYNDPATNPQLYQRQGWGG